MAADSISAVGRKDGDKPRPWRQSGKMKMVRLNSKIREVPRGCSRGFTIIEVLLAIAILGVIAVAFLSALATGSSIMVLADERTTAESLARRQMEYIKGQGYQADSELSDPIYQKIGGIPEGYSIYSLDRDGVLSEDIVGIPWDSENDWPADADVGIQKISLVIRHVDKMSQEKVIYTFTNDNPYWAYDVEITLEAYKVDR